MKTHTPHTPEPWSVVTPHPGQFAIVPENRQKHATTHTLAYIRDFQSNDEANAARIVACVNACEGIADPGAVPDLLAALRELMTGHSLAGQAMAHKAIARATGGEGGK
jgi:hypothetical protein